MSPIFATALINDNLLNEVAHSTVTLEPVLFFYGAAIAAAAMLWTVGVLVFGR
jgi:Mg2+/Co2+ transporter CorB